MTDETLNPPMADADANEKRRLLEVEATRLEIKFDKRFSDKRLADMIAEKGGESERPLSKSMADLKQTVAELEADEVRLAADPPPSVRDLQAQIDALKAQNAELAARPVLAPVRTGPPPGTLTSLDMGQSPAAQSDELAAAWRKATELGLAGAIPKGASIDQIMKRITDHLAAKAQEQQILEEQQRRKAAEPKQQIVRCRILLKGDGKVGKGVHLPGIGNSCYRRGEFVDLPMDIALAQQDNGYLEIEDAALHAV